MVRLIYNNIYTLIKWLIDRTDLEQELVVLEFQAMRMRMCREGKD